MDRSLEVELGPGALPQGAPSSGLVAAFIRSFASLGIKSMQWSTQWLRAGSVHEIRIPAAGPCPRGPEHWA